MKCFPLAMYHFFYSTYYFAYHCCYQLWYFLFQLNELKYPIQRNLNLVGNLHQMDHQYDLQLKTVIRKIETNFDKFVLNFLMPFITPNFEVKLFSV